MTPGETAIPADATERAVAADAAAFVAFVGTAGSGKTTALVRRAERLAAAWPASKVLLASANRRATLALAARRLADGVAVRGLDDVALEALRAGRFLTHLSPDLDVIADARAGRIFEEVGAELFRLDWTEFVSPEIDPEITGLRAPERFAASAFRLIRRLRAAGIDPERFRASWLAGATEFYGKPPNFGNPDLKTATKPAFRDSLLAGPEELERQRLRELDLARILSRLYESYAASLVASGCLTTIDVVVEAGRLLAKEPRLAERLRAALPRACVDDAQDLAPAHLSLLRAIYGEALGGVTFAGDARQRTRAFSGGVGELAFRGASETIVFEGFRRGRAAIVNVALRGADARFRPPVSTDEGAAGARPPAVVFARARDVDDEARIVAEFVVEALAGGTPPREIAVVTRTLRAIPPYLDALLARDVVCDVAGDSAIFDYAPVQDALGALWALADPFRHDWLMRNLEAPWMRLADATIARLCAEPSQPQTLLFEVPEEPNEARNRWDRRRHVRLGRNVLRGDADLDLTPIARERLAAFRAALARWTTLEVELELPELVRTIAGETVLATLPPGARGTFARDLIERFVAYVDAFAAAQPLATLHDLLEDVEGLVDREGTLLEIDRVRDGAVALLDVEAAKGREFALVVVIDARAGAFPRYYVPDAFIYTPSLGIVPKENVGDAAAARTAKFTYAMYKTKAQEKFLEEERRAFYVAASRARDRLVVTASGRATQGRAAPELLEELRRAGLAGTADLTGHRPGEAPT